MPSIDINDPDKIDQSQVIKALMSKIWSSVQQ